MATFHDPVKEEAERNEPYEERAFPHPDDSQWYKIRVRGVWIDDRDDRRWDHSMRFDQ